MKSLTEISTINEKPQPRLARTGALAAFLVALPAAIFYSILFRQAINLPDLDDYRSLLDFLNHMALQRSVGAKALCFLAAQYQEYKLFFENALIWLQYSSLRHIDFRVTCAIGNGFVLLLAILLWKMFLPGHKDITARLMLFVPVSWMIFQLQYVETLDWAMTSLQHLPVLVFSLGAIYLLMRSTRRAYCGALACLILAVASSANGVLVIPIGVWILAVSRRYLRLAIWLVVSSGCGAAYAYRYTASPVGGPLHFSILSTLIARPFYLLTFIGSSAAFPFMGGFVGIGIVLCPLVGLALTIFLVAKWRYFRKNPLIGYCVLFLLGSAAAVAVGRLQLGILHAYSSRYGIYSVLLLIFAWFAIADEPSRRISLGEVITLAILFSLSMDVVGWPYTVDRNRELVAGMTAFEHSAGGPILPRPGQSAGMDEADRLAPGILEESIRLGIYKPPQY